MFVFQRAMESMLDGSLCLLWHAIQTGLGHHQIDALGAEEEIDLAFVEKEKVQWPHTSSCGLGIKPADDMQGITVLEGGRCDRKQKERLLTWFFLCVDSPGLSLIPSSLSFLRCLPSPVWKPVVFMCIHIDSCHSSISLFHRGRVNARFDCSTCSIFRLMTAADDFRGHLKRFSAGSSSDAELRQLVNRKDRSKTSASIVLQVACLLGINHRGLLLLFHCLLPLSSSQSNHPSPPPKHWYQTSIPRVPLIGFIPTSYFPSLCYIFTGFVLFS